MTIAIVLIVFAAAQTAHATVRPQVKQHHHHVRVPLPPHYQLWLCIHRGEGAWNDNTGNGYYGGLQAHYNWYGVPRMDLLSPLRQMWHAEIVYRQSGYSRSWLYGQWAADARCF